MALGYQFAAICYPTLAQAQDAFFARELPIVSGLGGNGGSGSWTGYNLVNGVWKYQQFTFTSAGVYTLKFSVDPASSPTFFSCTVSDPADISSAGITAMDMLYVYTWGMGAVLMMWALGFAVAAAIGGIKRL